MNGVCEQGRSFKENWKKNIFILKNQKEKVENSRKYNKENRLG